MITLVAPPLPSATVTDPVRVAELRREFVPLPVAIERIGERVANRMAGFAVEFVRAGLYGGRR